MQAQECSRGLAPPPEPEPLSQNIKIYALISLVSGGLPRHIPYQGFATGPPVHPVFILLGRR